MPQREPIPCEPVDVILLAAGAARRFGGGKLLAPWRGSTVLGGALEVALGAPVRAVRLVIGCEAEAIEAEARAVAARTGKAERLKVVAASDWAEGLAASLRAGVRALPDETAAAFVGLADMPAVRIQTYAALIGGLATGNASAAAPVFSLSAESQGVQGNPVLFRRELFAPLLALSGDQGARRLLDALGPALAFVPVDDPGVVHDIDTPADLAQLSAA